MAGLIVDYGSDLDTASTAQRTDGEVGPTHAQHQRVDDRCEYTIPSSVVTHLTVPVKGYSDLPFFVTRLISMVSVQFER